MKLYTTEDAMRDALAKAVPCKRCHQTPTLINVEGLFYVQCHTLDCHTCSYETYQYLGTRPSDAVKIWNDYNDKDSDFNKEQRKHNKEVSNTL